MKVSRFIHLIILPWLFLLIAAVDAKSSETKPEVNLKKVTIYPQGAIVKKELKFKAHAGENVLNISDLPADLVDESLNISTKDSKGIKIVDVKIEKTFLKIITQERIDNLEKKLEEIEEKISKNQIELDTLKISIEFLKKSTPFSQNFKTTETEVESFAKYLEKSLKERLDKVSKIEKTIKELNEEKESIQKEISELKNSADSSKVATVIFTTDNPGEYIFEFSYMVNNASWKPRYDLKIDSQSKNFEIIHLAKITQNTQEDW